MATVGDFELLRGSSTPLLATGDILRFVDVSDPTQAPQGSLVSATVANYFAAIPTPIVVTSASAAALAVGLTGATNPAFAVDASTALQVAGLKVTGAVTGGTVAVQVMDSGAAANLSLNAKGTGTIAIGSASTGRVTITPVTTITGALTIASTLTGGATSDIAINTNKFTVAASSGNTVIAGALTLSAALTYGGVTLSNAVTGTGNMVLSASPTLSGTVGGALTFSGALTCSANVTMTNGVLAVDIDTMQKAPLVALTAGGVAMPSGVYTKFGSTGNALGVATSGDGLNSRILMVSAGAFSTNDIEGSLARGTLSAPTAVLSGDNLLEIIGSAYDGTTWAGASAYIQLQATETHSAIAHGTKIVLATTPNGSTVAAAAVTIGNDKSVAIGSTTTVGTDPGGTQSILRIGGGFRLTNSIEQAQPTASSDITYTIDNSNGSASPGVVIANNGTFQVGATSKYTGLLVVQDTATDAEWALVYASGAAVKIITQSSTKFSTTLANATTINLNYSAGAFLVENKTGVSRTLSIMPFRTRASN